MSSASANNSDDNLQLNDGNDSDEDAPKRVKRRIQQFSDSDSDKEVTQIRSDELGSQKEFELQDSKSSDNAVITVHKKSHIRKSNNKSSSDSEASIQDEKSVPKKNPKGSSSSGSDSDEAVFKSIPLKPHQEASIESSDSDTVKYGQHMRMKNKRNKMKDKFKNLLSSRGKEKASNSPEKEQTSINSSNSDDDEVSSIEKIKQKIKEKMSYKPSICDPDTSDEESGSRQKSMPKQKKEKRTKMISPKPQRMSAKQAMENMQKIKSESNRMLREKEVTLPYHRPKALSLKDIMSRRKPAMSSDGKCLPIKMNGDQLKQYAQQLEDRQKQMMELWQSDSDGDNYDNQSDDEKPVENSADDKKLEEGTNNDELNVELGVSVLENVKEVTKLTEADISAANDELFDVLSQSIIVDKANDLKEKASQLESINDKATEEQDTETNFKLVLNESETSITEEKQDNNIAENSQAVGNIEVSSIIETNKSEHQVSESAKLNTESDSQLVSLHYDSEMLDTVKTTEVQPEISLNEVVESDKTNLIGDETENNDKEIEEMDVDGFSDDDMNIEDIDNIIENAEVIRDFEDKVNSQVLIRDRPLNLNPKLTGSPGMVIDLDNSDTLPKKSGVELLKERFTFFAKLKTPEEMERAKKGQVKPGRQHLRLKQELEQQMAEQRSLEWTKRLEDEKLQHKEIKELRGEESDDENDIDKIEAKLDDENVENEPESSESEEEELLENDIEMMDKPRTKNPMLENEADESDCEETKGKILENEDENEENTEVNDGDDEDDEESSDDSESSESEEEQKSTKKGRILKAFEDSDEEDATKETETTEDKSECKELQGSQLTSQDDVLTLAQRHKSVSEDLFTSQGSSLFVSQIPKSPILPESVDNDVDLGTQTFSILDSSKNTSDFLNPSLGGVDTINDNCGTQTYVDTINPVMCSGSFSQDLPPLPISHVSQSQTIGDDILALCTGKFYDNEFVSQAVDNQTPLGASQEFDDLNVSPVQMSHRDETQEAPVDIIETEEVEGNTINEEFANKDIESTENKVDQTKIVDANLKSILDELDDPEFDEPKPNKFFCGATQKQTEKEQVIKKKLIIDSDDDNEADASEIKKRKKVKKKKPEMRALQISDDEEDEVSDLEEYESDVEEENEERLVDYDSEENEIEIKPKNENPKLSKKKRKGTEFFEQEAELTSEDEWAGSGDEDEAGLDRMEREVGDDDTFHQGRLQRELGLIHMREVIDQDKREVRIIQELLFEDGDLGAGGRQRKFKWKNLDGDEETGTGGDEFKDTQEEEFESEEQWRKQRHERESFLRQMQNNGEHDDSLNVSINRTTIIKANLMSKTMSTLLAENQPPSKKEDIPVETEKKTKDIPSPKKPFSILQQSYQGSILNRGGGALARLAALATPLATDDDKPKGKSAVTSSARNFVFATLTPEAPKISKRKADTNPGTPALVKKMKTEEKQNMTKSRLLEHMKV